jgi:lipoic acid synthetase
MIERRTPKPGWLKTQLPQGNRYRAVRETIARESLHTVCQEAHCPNMGECWESGTATFLILGDRCTRGCAFCAVATAEFGNDQGENEPELIAAAANRMGLSYVVVTSVSRDDLPDGGAGRFADVLRRLRRLRPPPLTEVLIPDYLGTALDSVLAAEPDVLAHNVEVVERLTAVLRHTRFDYRRSLAVLQEAGTRCPEAITKSSVLLGVGETDAEVYRTMEDLRAVGTRVLVLGQYLQPTAAHAPVARFVPPAAFSEFAEAGRAIGFEYVAAGPLVRTSYRAAEAYVLATRGGAARHSRAAMAHREQ